MTVYNFDPESDEESDEENADEENPDEDREDTVSEKSLQYPKEVDGTPNVPILEGSFNTDKGTKNRSTKNKSSTTKLRGGKTKQMMRKTQMGKEGEKNVNEKRGGTKNKEPGTKKSQNREVESTKDAIHFPPRIDIKNGDDVLTMNKVPIAFHYELKSKPHNHSEEQLELVPDKLIVRKKTKRQEEIQKAVWIKKSEQSRTTYEYEVMQNIDNLVDSEDKAKELLDQIVEKPEDFRFLELSPSENRKIEKKNKKLENVIDKEFGFVEIVRVSDPSDPLKSNPFTGIFPYLTSFLKMIDCLNH